MTTMTTIDDDDGDDALSIDLAKAHEAVKDLREGELRYVQRYTRATGLGSLEAARGSEHVVADDAVLSGEVDVTGAPWDGRSWRDDAWNGRSWRSDGWLGRSWRSDGWLGRSWRSDAWLGRSWRGGAWLAAEFVPTDPLW